MAMVCPISPTSNVPPACVLDVPQPASDTRQPTTSCKPNQIDGATESAVNSNTTSPVSEQPKDGQPPDDVDKASSPLFAEKDFRRVGKMAYNATLGVIAISVSILMSIPQKIESHQLNIYACAGAFASLSLLASFGVIYYSISNPVGEKLAWVQQKAMVVYGCLLSLAVFSRMAALFPPLLFVFMLLTVFIVLALVILYLYFAWQAEKKIQ